MTGDICQNCQQPQEDHVHRQILVPGKLNAVVGYWFCEPGFDEADLDKVFLPRWN